MRLVVDRFRGHGSALFDDKGEEISSLLFDVQIEGVDFDVAHTLDEIDDNSVITIDQTLRPLALDNGMFINVKAGNFYLPVQVIAVGTDNKYKIHGNFSEYVDTEKLTIHLDESVFKLGDEFVDGIYYNDTREMICVSSNFATLNIKPTQVYAEYPPLRNASFDYQVQEWINKSMESVMNMIPHKFQLSIEQSYHMLETTDLMNFIVWGALEYWEATLDSPVYRFTGKLRDAMKRWTPKFLSNEDSGEIQSFTKWSHW